MNINCIGLHLSKLRTDISLFNLLTFHLSKPYYFDHIKTLFYTIFPLYCYLSMFSLYIVTCLCFLFILLPVYVFSLYCYLSMFSLYIVTCLCFLFILLPVYVFSLYCYLSMFSLYIVTCLCFLFILLPVYVFSLYCYLSMFSPLYIVHPTIQ